MAADIDNLRVKGEACSSGEGTTRPPIFDNHILHVAAPSEFDVFSEEEVARMLGVEPKTIRNLILRSRELTYVPIGKTRRVLRKDLETFLERRRVKCVEDISPVAKKE